MKLISTKTKDGLRYNGLLSEPLGEKKGIIVHIHGMAGDFYSNYFYSQMHKKYSESGWAFLAGENRGTGNIRQFEKDNGEFPYIGNAYEVFEESLIDIQTWIDKAIELGYEKIWLQGHSLGPSKVAYYISQIKPKNIEGLIFISPSDMLGLVYSDKDEFANHQEMIKEAEELIASGKENDLLTKKLWGDTLLSAKTYLNFFSKDSNTGIFNYNSLNLGWDVVNSIYLPVLAITGTKDDGIVSVIDANQAMKMLEKELKNSPRVKTIVYQDTVHSFKDFEKELVNDILRFIEDK